MVMTGETLGSRRTDCTSFKQPAVASDVLRLRQMAVSPGACPLLGSSTCKAVRGAVRAEGVSRLCEVIRGENQCQQKLYTVCSRSAACLCCGSSCLPSFDKGIGYAQWCTLAMPKPLTNRFQPRQYAVIRQLTGGSSRSLERRQFRRGQLTQGEEEG